MLVAGALTNRAGQAFGLRAALATDETLSVNHLSVQNAQALTLSVTGNVPVKIIQDAVRVARLGQVTISR
jgi:hypothetical protein